MRRYTLISLGGFVSALLAVTALTCGQAAADDGRATPAPHPFDAPVTDDVLHGERGANLSGLTPDLTGIQVGAVLWDDVKHPLPPKPPQPRHRDGTLRTSVSVNLR